MALRLVRQTTVSLKEGHRPMVTAQKYGHKSTELWTKISANGQLTFAAVASDHGITLRVSLTTDFDSVVYGKWA